MTFRRLLMLATALVALSLWSAGALASDPPEAEQPAATDQVAAEHEGAAEHAAEEGHGPEDTAEHEHGEAGHGDAGHGDTGHGDDGHGHGSSSYGKSLGLLWCAPFAGILLSIALGPLVAPHFWHRHYPKASAFWALAFAVPALITHGMVAWHEIVHIYLIDYIPFIILLFGLFTVAGGIVVRGSLRGTPLVNTMLLLIGTALASWVGTTGAAMVMIRPLLRANAHRKDKVHIIVFFIFLVANIGGALTPLGDPPLFLGFLHSVPFFWTLALFPAQSFVVVILLAIFFALDTFKARKEAPAPEVEGEKVKLGLAGAHNLLFLGGIVGLVLLSGMWKAGEISILGIPVTFQNIVRDIGILVMAGLSLWTTKKALRRENEFSWEPIREVAYLFAGIFMTIIPALAILKAGEEGQLAGLVRAANEPWQYYWITGTLSSFLDNAPTYLTFFNTALGKFYPGVAEPAAVAQLIEGNEIYLLAISCGAVFMGACTYIGNAPNFMVKSIAEEQGIKMPSFFGYIVRWTLPVLVPVFAVVTWIFFL